MRRIRGSRFSRSRGKGQCQSLAPSRSKLKLMEVNEEEKGNPCLFCQRSNLNDLHWGQMYHIGDIRCHYFCLLFSSGVPQQGEDNEGILGFLPQDIKKELRRGRKLKCKFCKKSGATIGCCEGDSCTTSYHFPCGLAQKSVFLFTDNFSSFCRQHIPRKTLSATRLPEKINLSSLLCIICHEDATSVQKQQGKLIFPKCCFKKCKPPYIMHRDCLMKQALAQGSYTFRCTICNCHEYFQRQMKYAGVFVPERDQIWEIDPNSYAELAKKYSNCDQKTCRCPNGRSHDDTKDKSWKIVRCGGCAASAVHKFCGNLSTNSYRCKTCARILKGL